MRPWVLIVLALAATPALAEPARCLGDGAIAANERADLGRIASTYTEVLMRGDAAATQAMMTPQGRAATTSDIVTGVGAVIQTMEPGPRKVARTLLVENPDVWTGDVVCGDSSRRDTPVQLLAGSRRQATVEVAIPSLNNEFVLVVFLIPQDGAWKVHGFHLATARAAGKSAFDLVDMARAEDRKDHVFNASMLLLTAAGMIDRGPILHFVGTKSIMAEIETFAAAPELVGERPYSWNLGGRRWRVTNVGVLAVGGEFTVMIDWAPERWDGDVAADRDNRVLLEAFMAARPEWKDIFSAVFAKAVSPEGFTDTGGPAFTTGYITGRGFGPPPTE